MAHFDDLIANAHLVITGEGRIDDQTLHGKAPAGVLKAAQRKGIPTIALCGSIAPGTNVTKMGFKQVVPTTPPHMPLKEAMNTEVTLHNVKSATRRVLKSFFF